MALFALPPSGNAVSLSALLSAAARARRGWEDGFEQDFSAHCGVEEDELLYTDSGSTALWVLLAGLRSLDRGRGRVAVPAWCCPSVPQAVIKAGLEPVPVDIDPATLGYDPEALRAVRGGLLAVVLVHYFGLPQPFPEGAWPGITFLRDCAQDFEHGAGGPCFYSFGRGKALNAGHGGACFPGGEPLLSACRKAWQSLPQSRAHPLAMALAINGLSRPRLYWALTRLPFLGLGRTAWEEWSCARIAPEFFPVGEACLRAYLARRSYYLGLVRRYRDLFSSRHGLFVPRAGATWLPVRFPVLIPRPRLRESLLSRVNARFGGVTRLYPDVLGRLPGAPPEFASGRFPGAARVARELIAFPITAELRGREDAYFACLREVLTELGAVDAYPDWTPVAGEGIGEPEPGSPESLKNPWQ